MTSVAILIALLWACCSVATTALTALYLHRVRPLRQPEPDGRALLIVPVRGPAPRLPEVLDSLLAQDWPEFRIVVSVESEADPAHAVAAAAAERDSRITVVVAGEAERRGQKVHNLLAALPLQRLGDRFVVFFDADAIAPRGFLRALLRPLLYRVADLASGYRIVVPEPGSAGGLLVALADHGISTFPRMRAIGVLSGGSTAIRAEILPGFDLPRLWEGALSDDLTLTRRARGLGVAIHGVHAALLPSPMALSVPEAFRFGVRQMRLLRLHLPRLWAVFGAFSLLPVLGTLLLLAGAPGAAAAALVAFLSLQLRLSLRRAILARVLPREALPPLERAILLGRLLTPLAVGFRAACWAASAFSRRIAWAGITYEVEAPDRVRILSRTPPG
ncbi:MAG: glycosyltransferase family 2 protein [Acetobacteraceae bacterium]|nr:glycosyltransferase family 2 protein [Acetobacteraceae bacterium]